MKTLVKVLLVFVVVFLFISGRLFPPVKISFRPSLIEGKVLVLENKGDRALRCTVRAFGDSSNGDGIDSLKHSLVLKPFSKKGIGMLECGWCFVNGEYGWVSASGSLLPKIFFVSEEE